MSKNEITTFSDIGKEYRQKYPLTRIKGIILQSIVSLIIVIAFAIFLLFCLGIIGLTKDEFWIAYIFTGLVSFGLLSTFVALIVLRAILRKKQLRNSDEWLGKKYAITNKRVKGCAIRKVRPFLIALPIITFVFLVFNLGVVLRSYLERPAQQENLVQVEGEVVYFDVAKMKSSEMYTFVLKDNTTLYRISYDSYYPCDKSIKDEVKVGDYVYLSIDSTEKTSHTSTEGYEGVSNVYSFCTATKEYLTYEQYLNYFNEDLKITSAIYYVNYSISGLAFLGLLASVAFLIVRSVKEDIRISNLS